MTRISRIALAGFTALTLAACTTAPTKEEAEEEDIDGELLAGTGETGGAEGTGGTEGTGGSGGSGGGGLLGGLIGGLLGN